MTANATVVTVTGECVGINRVLRNWTGKPPDKPEFDFMSRIEFITDDVNMGGWGTQISTIEIKGTYELGTKFELTLRELPRG